jgi:hypothetical protein
MDNHSLIALAALGTMSQEARSALPGAPVVTQRPGPTPRRPRRLLSRVARVLHRAAWALDPVPSARAEARQ